MDPDEGHTPGDDHRVPDEGAGDELCREEDSDGDHAHHDDGELHGLPTALFGLLGIPRPEVLADEGRRGDREPEPGHECEALDPQADLVRREDLRAKNDDHADPQQKRDLQEDLLERGGPADSEDPSHGVHMHPSAGQMEFQTMLSPKQDRDQGERPNDVGDRRPDRGAGHPEAGDERVSEDQIHVDAEIDDVHEHAEPQGRDRVAGAAERGTSEEGDELEEDDERDDPDVRPAEGNDIGRGTEHGEHRFREEEAEQRQREGQEGSQDQALLQDVIRFREVVRADGPSDQGDRSCGDADHDAEEQEDELPSEADRGDGGGGLGPEGPDHDHVDRRGQRLEQVGHHDGPCELKHGGRRDLRGCVRRRPGHPVLESPFAICPLALRRLRRSAR